MLSAPKNSSEGACPLGLPRAALSAVRQSKKGKASSDSPGQPEPQVKVLSDRLEEAKRRTRAPTTIAEGTAPPHVCPTTLGPLRRRPLKHVPDHVAGALRARSGRIQPHRRRMPDLALVIVRARGIDVVVSPRVLRTVRATGRAFPFLLGGQPCARPLAICRSLMPRHVHHEPIRMLLLLVPVLRCAVWHGPFIHKRQILRHRYRVLPDPERQQVHFAELLVSISLLVVVPALRILVLRPDPIVPGRRNRHPLV